MQNVTIRELMHNFSAYLTLVKKGERIIILERKTPIADIIPHNNAIAFPGWKRPIKRLKLKKKSFAQSLTENRNEER